MTTEKRFRMSKPYRLITNDDGNFGISDCVAPVTPEGFLDALFGIQVEGKSVDALFWCGLRNPCGPRLSLGVLQMRRDHANNYRSTI